MGDDLSQPVDKAAAAQFDAILTALALRVANAARRLSWKTASFFRRFSIAADFLRVTSFASTRCRRVTTSSPHAIESRRMALPLTPLRFLERAMNVYGSKTGIVCGEKEFTYAEFGRRCGQLATALASLGVRDHDRVAYLSFNTHKLLEGYYGVIQAGAIVMPLNVRLAVARAHQHSESRRAPGAAV